MSARTKRERDILKRVTKIRASNNVLWVSIMELALEASPKKAKKIIRQITTNDRRISFWLSRV